ncbi:cysteine synthase A [Rhodospirillum rubrum]|uniref:cysteine synthase A n=1 Tax=Rhodospirillum rubrum TaxID=1085 RepID=UPI001906E870|nr:cysteine synthase A [Rhodospirillum rubrum]MBK1665167.1 cysteine synthase A [Rhodospirillum rubrum]MBK1676790.1 cysteine synthase A [Rhodospirillum rubrum]
MTIRDGFLGAIGGTPLIRLPWASRITGREILGKAEFLNPGGSVKDRAALAIITDALERGALAPGGTIVEGTAGNTGIGLTLVGNAIGCKTVIVMPETQSQEKKDALRLCGADLRLVAALPYKDPGNYVRYSETLAKELGGFWANQFDNTANRDGHRATTGREIIEQCEGRLDAFTCAVGTGGTLAGVALALKAHDPAIKVVLADPAGSALYSWITTGELKAEGGSVTEGIGQGRVTANLRDAPLDEAVRIDDAEALGAIFAMVREDGLMLGGSSGVNVAAAMKVARGLPKGSRVVTILCDGAQRYQSKLFNPDFLRSKALPVPDWLA